MSQDGDEESSLSGSCGAEGNSPLFVSASEMLLSRPSEPEEVSSLLVVSLPRSLSSLTYQVARRALGLAEPVWTTDGEILNSDRLVLRGDTGPHFGLRFTRPAEAPAVCTRLYSFLNQVVNPRGFAYKDVVQPFVVAAWLSRYGRGIRVLRIRRPLVDVAMAMLSRGWMYPARRPAEGAEHDRETALLQGLLDAEAALDAVAGEAIEYDSLIRDETALWRALRHLAPGQGLREIPYITADFRRVRSERLGGRKTERYRELTEKLQALRPGASRRSA